MAGATRRMAGMGAAAAGMLLIAATYGMARFGVGLFAPAIAESRPGLIGILGWAAAAQFAAYCVAALAAARLADRHPRTGLVLAGATAAAGCLGIAVATDPAVFVISVLVGGMGGGFASPALVPVIDAVVPRPSAASAQSVANAGTATGVIGAGLVAFTPLSVGSAWTLMAVVCVLATVAAWYPVRRRTDLGRHAPSDPAEGAGAGMRALLVPAGAALVVGAGSSLAWTFGPLLVTDAGTVAAEQVGWLWIVLGLGGFLGAFAGRLVDRTGLRGGWWACSLALALGTAGVAVAVGTGRAWAAYAGMAVFGAGYMGMSGILILWARAVRPSSAGAGTSVLFIALAVGQAAGSAGFGAAMDLIGPVFPAAVAAVLCAAGGAVVLAGRRTAAAVEAAA